MNIGGQRRLAVVAACVSLAGILSLPFAGSLGSPTTELATVAGPPTADAPPPTTAPPAPAPVAAPAPSPVHAPAPAPSAGSGVAPPIHVDDPTAGVGAPLSELLDPDPGGTVPPPPSGPAESTSPPGLGPLTLGPVLGPLLGGGEPDPPPPPKAEEVPEPAPQPVALHPERIWAVNVGIDDYPGTQYDLTGAVGDARAATDSLLRLGVPGDHILEVTDRAATVDGILAAVNWIVARAGPDDTAVFTYAGHVEDLGRGTEVVVTADGGWVADWYLAERFLTLRARDAWMVIAGCYGGGFDELLAPGRILTAGAPAGQLAYESSTYGKSFLGQYVFQYALIEGGAALPTVQDAVGWAMDRLAREYPEHQLWNADWAGHVVSLDGARRDGSEPTPAPPSPPPSTTPPEPPRDCALLVFCR